MSNITNNRTIIVGGAQTVEHAAAALEQDRLGAHAPLDETEILDEHAGVLRGRGEGYGDGYPQYFSVMSCHLPQKWFDYFYCDEFPYSLKDAHDMHGISSQGLTTDELEQLQRAALASSVKRIMDDPAYEALHRAIIDAAVKDGQFDRFEAARALKPKPTTEASLDFECDADDFFGNLARQDRGPQ